MNRREAERLTHQQDTLRALGFTRDEAESLRRISMTLHRWHERECGTDSGCIERGRKERVFNVETWGWDRTFFNDENGTPHWADHSGDRPRYYRIPDREAGAKRRLAAILKARNDRSGENPPEDWEDCEQCGSYHPAGYTGDCRDDSQRWPGDGCKPLTAYIQGDPRGAALYVLRPGDVPAGESADAFYTRGICVY